MAFMRYIDRLGSGFMGPLRPYRSYSYTFMGIPVIPDEPVVRFYDISDEPDIADEPVTPDKPVTPDEPVTPYKPYKPSAIELANIFVRSGLVTKKMENKLRATELLYKSLYEDMLRLSNERDNTKLTFKQAYAEMFLIPAEFPASAFMFRCLNKYNRQSQKSLERELIRRALRTAKGASFFRLLSRLR
jgi:hypothetical protein